MMKQSYRARLWTAMRTVVGDFSADQIVELASDGESQAAQRAVRYLRELRNTGYLGEVRRGRYTLQRDTGPTSPVPRWREQSVYDRNHKKTYHFSAVEGREPSSDQADWAELSAALRENTQALLRLEARLGSKERGR